MIPNPPVTAILKTDVGRVRDHNEDYFASCEPTQMQEAVQNSWCYILADGAGGMDAGEVASQHSTERMHHHYLAQTGEKDWSKRLVRAMEAANTDLRRLMLEQDEGKSRMATTMVAVVIAGDRAIFANVGDSRGYHFRDGAIKQITKDQSLVAKLLEEGAITPEEAENHPRRNVILGSLGSEDEIGVDLFTIMVEPGDHLLLCSDGLTNYVRDKELAEIIRGNTLEEAPQLMISLANARGGGDNISVVLIRINHTNLPTEGATNVALPPAVTSTLWPFTFFLCTLLIFIITVIWALMNG
ncbi:MAG: Stp1/IreP family PP2C-type Ser/Thr phosphatase [Chloroflexi bacterium]|nr:Stp1/IreP family PP2C-type Ser/Thr phosphatase [Chloroflexota bacterium]MBP8057887.1 Stp1/IreP family PP2C-type Ser/Thr phosphatase [Chloroflexota bacterium]